MPQLKIIQNSKEQVLTFDGAVLLSDYLIKHDYFVPHHCGGRGICKKCTVLLNGSPVLACCSTVSFDSTVILPDKEIIADFARKEELGYLTENVCLCLDIGTTTIALALVSLDENAVIRSVSLPNPQRAFGTDVISRIDYCSKNGTAPLQKVLLEKINETIKELLEDFGLGSVERMYVAGNTTMLHILFGEDCSSLGYSPYEPVFLEKRKINAFVLGIKRVKVIISLPGISTFVGADIVAGINFVGHPSPEKYRILIDLGTNAEIALFSRSSILCTAAAAGPCFEGANISCGMTATKGAIYSYNNGDYSVIGGGKPRGLCATGLIDAVADFVRRGIIDESGFIEDDYIRICENVFLTKQDIREFQLAKSAIRAATECLLKEQNIDFSQIEGLYVAGGFSDKLNVENAAYLGLIPEQLIEKFICVSNSSLSGTVRYACENEKLNLPLTNAKYANLSLSPLFSELFAEYMFF